MPGKYPPKAVANWFIDRFNRASRPITQLQVHKLVYIAHGFHLALDPKGTGLVSEHLKAWRFGPVLPSLRDEFREFGNQPITRMADEWLGPGYSLTPRIDEYSPEEWELALLEGVFKRYGHMSGPQLIDWTHREGGPWHQCTGGGRFAELGVTIPDELIRQCFAAEVERLESTTAQTESAGALVQ